MTLARDDHLTARRAVCVLTVIAVLVGGTPPASAQDESAALLTAVRDAWSKREAAAKSVRASWTEKVLHPKGVYNRTFPDMVPAGLVCPPADAIHDGAGSLLIGENKTRLKQTAVHYNVSTGTYSTDDTDSSFDGSQYTKFYKIGSQAFPAASLKKATNNDQTATASAWPILVYYRGLNHEMMHRQGFQIYAAARRSQLDGKPVVELVRPRDETRNEAKLWVDPDREYAVLRSAEYTPEGKVISQTTVKPDGRPGMPHHPAGWTIHIYRKGLLAQTITAELRGIEFNPATTRDDFRIRLPVGTEVTDATSDKPVKYIIREDNRKRMIPEDERAMRYEDLVRTEPGELTGRRPGWWQRYGLAVVVGTGLVVAPAAFLLFRWRRASRTGSARVTKGELS